MPHAIFPGSAETRDALEAIVSLTGGRGLVTLEQLWQGQKALAQGLLSVLRGQQEVLDRLRSAQDGVGSPEPSRTASRP